MGLEAGIQLTLIGSRWETGDFHKATEAAVGFACLEEVGWVGQVLTVEGILKSDALVATLVPLGKLSACFGALQLEV